MNVSEDKERDPEKEEERRNFGVGREQVGGIHDYVDVLN